MKIFFPRHITGGWFNLNFQIGPLTINLIQLVIVAAGVAMAAGLRSSLIKKNIDKWIAAVFVVPIIAVTLVIAFFRVSELGLLAFVGKLIQTNILNETKKYQVNFEHVDPFTIDGMIMKAQDDGTNQSLVVKKWLDLTRLRELEYNDILK